MQPLKDKFGLAPKAKNRLPVSDSLKDEKKKKQNNLIIKLVIGVIYFSSILFFYPRTTIQEPNYKIGEPWTQEDLTAPFTFSLQKTNEEFEREKQLIIDQTPPIFIVDNNVDRRILNRLDSLLLRIDVVFESYLIWQSSKFNNLDTQTFDSLQFEQAKISSGVGFDENGWNGLFKTNEDSLSTNFQKLDKQELKESISSIVFDLLNQGIIDQSKRSIEINEITVRNLKNRTERNQYLVDVRDLKDCREYAQFELSQNFKNNRSVTAAQLFNLIIESNLIYSETETQNRIDEFLSTISPTKGAVTKGQVIIRKGDLITKERLNYLNSYLKAKSQQASEIQIWKQYTGQVIVIIAINMIFIMYIYLYRRPIYENNKLFFLLFLLIGLILASNAFLSSFEYLSPYLLPVAIVPIILTIIFDSRVGILTTLVLSLIIGLFNGYDFEFTTATVTACSMAVYSVRDIKNRSQFYIYTPALILFTYLFIYVGFDLVKTGTFQNFLPYLIDVIINALLNLVLIYPLILLVERIFKVTTDVTLLELSDTNRPLLKNMMLKASGTFHHSLQVANLSEAAATTIGANALLCRVGALYHDIGKTEKPEYFVENQSGMMNVHEKLKPRMSALVIKEHVKKGIALAEEYKLPDVIHDFIQTHHGTSIIRYFFEKGKKNSDNPDEIKEEDFRYDGPNPSTKETGIVMLADSVEASSRTLQDPTYSSLENHIDRIFDEKLDEGQLNNCPLTFQDLQRIKETFLTILVGVYHARIKYPEKDDDDSSKTKKSEKKEAVDQTKESEKPTKKSES